MDGAALITDSNLAALADMLGLGPLEEGRRGAARHELSDAAWALIGPLLPQPKSGPGRRGRPAKSARTMLNGVLWLLRTGAPWRDLPRFRFGPWQTVYTRFSCWRAEGVIDRLVEGLQGQLNEDGAIDWNLWCVDGSVSRAARCAAGARKKGARSPSRKTTRSASRAVDTARSSIC